MLVNNVNDKTHFKGYVDKKVIKLINKSTSLEMDRLFEEWNKVRHEPPSRQISYIEEKSLQVLEIMSTFMQKLHPKSVLSYKYSKDKKAVEFYISNSKLNNYKYNIGDSINYDKYQKGKIIDISQLITSIQEQMSKNIDKSMFTNFYKQIITNKNNSSFFQKLKIKYFNYKKIQLEREFNI